MGNNAPEQRKKMTAVNYAPATPRKSPGVGFLLGFLFGPFGMFYVSAKAGLISLIYLPFVFFTGGFGLLGWWLFGFLGLLLVSSANNKADFEARNQVNWNALTDEQKLAKQQEIQANADARNSEIEKKKEEYNNKTHWEKNKVGYIVFAGVIVGIPLLAFLVNLV
jgi:hypothetical protein